MQVEKHIGNNQIKEVVKDYFNIEPMVVEVSGSYGYRPFANSVAEAIKMPKITIPLNDFLSHAAHAAMFNGLELVQEGQFLTATYHIHQFRSKLLAGEAFGHLQLLVYSYASVIHENKGDGVDLGSFYTVTTDFLKQFPGKIATRVSDRVAMDEYERRLGLAMKPDDKDSLDYLDEIMDEFEVTEVGTVKKPDNYWIAWRSREDWDKLFGGKKKSKQ